MRTFETEYFKQELFKIFEINKIDSLLNDEIAEKFALLTEIMLCENEKYNLTAIKELDKIILLHYADSVAKASLFEKNATVIDVGCGGGFPSIPLAICRPDMKITALDSTAKKVNYVDMVSKELALNINAICARAEEISKVGADNCLREKFDFATARAVADLSVLSELCIPFVKQNGKFIVMKGKNGSEELDRAKDAISILGAEIRKVEEFVLVDKADVIYERGSAVIEKYRHTPTEYPRNFSQIQKKPIKRNQT